MKTRLLVVEDDVALGRVLSDNLTFAGFEVRWVRDGEAALQATRAVGPDLILLDLMLPKRSGLELCGVLRHSGRTPIIMLTARGQVADKVRGLKAGADDYITKPFHLEELVARIQAILRRTRPSVDRLVLADITIDFAGLRAWARGQELHFTHQEFEVLRYLAERPGIVVSRDELLREVWGYLDSPNTRSVDHAIARLRKKIEIDPHHPRFIHTAQGDGYCLTLEGSSDASHSPV